MRPPLPAILLICGVFATGCSGGVPPAGRGAKPGGPHGGTVVRLPDDSGCIEYLLETEAGVPMPPANVAKKRSRERVRIAAYFLGGDGATAMSPAPSAARLRLATDERTFREVELMARPRPGDPGGSARFVSLPDFFVPEMLRGTTIATVDGRDVRAPIALR
jgi:hypothetical protein